MTRLVLALGTALATWFGAAPANSQSSSQSSQEPWHERAAAPVLSSPEGALASDPRRVPTFSGLSLRQPGADLPPSLPPTATNARAWRDLLGPLGDVAAVLSARPKLVVLATSPDEHAPGARVTLQCNPPRCGALVLARF